jgi:predicted O-methyltransferase YrrM
MNRSYLLNPYVKGLADKARKEWHTDAENMKTPSVEPDVGMFLEYFTYASKPEKILEIGCGIGVSTRYMAEGFPDAEITAIDYNKQRLDHAVKACENYGNIKFIHADGLQFCKKLNDEYDLIFVDSVKRFYPIIFTYVYPHLKRGSSIIFDDMFMYGNIFLQDCEIPEKYRRGVEALRDFINKIKHNHKHMLLPVGGGIMVVGKE